MAANIKLNVIHGTYGRGQAQLVVTRNLADGSVRIAGDKPVVTLDAEGHRALLSALGAPTIVTTGPNPLQGDGSGTPLPPFSQDETPKIGGPR